jgi:hypothetical protein
MARLPLVPEKSSLVFADYLTDSDYDQNGFDFFDITEFPLIEDQPDDIKHLVKNDDRIEYLSHLYYGNIIFWRLIAVKNNLELLPVDLIPGDEIIIPSPRYINTIYYSKRK